MRNLTNKKVSIHRCLIVFLLTLPSSFPVFASESELNWQKVKDKDGIQVYRAHSEESRFKTFRAVTKIELENIQSFVGLMLDEKAYTKWLHMVSDVELTLTDDVKRFELVVETRLPWPVSDRFTKSDVILSQGDDYSVKFELLEPNVPAEPRKGFVLAPVSRGFYAINTIPDSKEVEVIVELFVDPGGYVPAFFVNLITDDMSYYSMQKFRKIIQIEKYQTYSTDLVERRSWLVAE